MGFPERRSAMLRLVVLTPDTPPVEVATIEESQLGHLDLYDDAELVAHLVVRPFTEMNEVEIAVADARTWEWLSRVRVPAPSPP
jgi:hypothetical protein